jgi:hypothetical protein
MATDPNNPSASSEEDSSGVLHSSSTKAMDTACYALRLILVSYAHLYLYSALSVLTGPFIRVTGISRT